MMAREWMMPVDWCAVDEKPHHPASMCNCNGRLDRLNAYWRKVWETIKFEAKEMQE